MINISIDDVSPHPMSSVKVLEQCDKLIERYRDIKFTLFIPISYWRTIGETFTRKPLSIDQYPDFCNVLKNLPKDNYELGFHGYHHGIPMKSNNDEFENINYNQATKLFDMMFETVSNAGLQKHFKPLFRPPAWRMSSEAIRAARDKGIKVLALSTDDYAIKTYDSEDKKKQDVVYYDSCPPFKPLQQMSKNEIVYHACQWDKNYLSEEKANELIEFINLHDDPKFCFIQDFVNG